MDKEFVAFPNGPCGKKTPPGGLPDIFVALEYLLIVFFLKVASEIYNILWDNMLYI